MAVIIYKDGQKQKVSPFNLHSMLKAGWYLDEECTDNGMKEEPEPELEPEVKKTSKKRSKTDEDE